MEPKEWIALYGAVTGTAGLYLHWLKYRSDSPRLRLECYLGRGSGAYLVPFDMRIEGETDADRQKARPLVAFDLVNESGRKIVVTHIGGTFHSGERFMLRNPVRTNRGTVPLPQELDVGQKLIAVSEDILPPDEVRWFEVSDATGNKWTTKPKVYGKQLNAAQRAGLALPPRR